MRRVKITEDMVKELQELISKVAERVGELKIVEERLPAGNRHELTEDNIRDSVKSMLLAEAFAEVELQILRRHYKLTSEQEILIRDVFRETLLSFITAVGVLVEHAIRTYKEEYVKDRLLTIPLSEELVKLYAYIFMHRAETYTYISNQSNSTVM